MVGIHSKSILVVSIVTVLCLFSPGQAEIKKIVVAGGDSFVPGSFLNADGQPDGMDIELWRLWSENTGVEVEIRLMEWKQTIPELLAGRVDVVDGVSYTPERAEYLDFSEPYGGIHTYIFFHKGIGGIRGLKDIAGFPVGVVAGTHTLEFLNREASDLRLLLYDNHEELVSAALNGRLRVFVSEDPLISYFFSKSGRRIDFLRIKNPMLTGDLRMAVRKGDADLLALVEEGLNTVTNDDWRRILDKWTGVSLLKQLPWKWIGGSAGFLFLCLILLLTWNNQLRKRVNKATQTLQFNEKQLQVSLKEKDILLKEIHHRVKNNLQVISGLLNLQARHIIDRDSKETYKESQNRIITMALIHEELYQARDLGKVDLAAYIKNLASSLFLSYGIDEKKVKLVLETDNIDMIVDTAIPCGLIINELITNSLKHAFPENGEGEIRVAFRDLDSGDFELRVSDNGVGLPRNFDIEKTSTLGLKLVMVLIEQLQGTLELENQNGASFIITFREYMEAGTELH
ncbi:transporter substrate-binding domain-containing protein [bacterium]|nr:MAG: transporter substrate-binding domain-containing protein [bacterium]